MSQSEKFNMLSLPPEVIENILKHLSYKDIEAVRPTCKLFNDTGVHLQTMAMQKLRKKVDRVEQLFIDAKWFKAQHSSDCNRLSYMKRMNRGACSIIILAALVRITYACTFHFIQKRLLPPLPGALLDGFERALSLATRRNPLVGKERLTNITSQVFAYVSNIDLWPDFESQPELVYKTIIDLLDNLPLRKEQMEVTLSGFQYKCLLPKLTIMMNKTDNAEYNANEIIIALTRLGLQSIKDFIYTDQPNFLITNDGLEQSRVEFSEAQLLVACASEENTAVTFLRELMKVEPVGFRVILQATEIPEEGEVLTLANVITYASRDYPVCQLPTV